MKRYECYSDIGSVLVGNKEVRFALPNIGGDGTTTLEVYDEEDYVPEHYRFVTCIEGKFNVYSYDCSKGADEDVLLKLEGRFGVYQAEYKVAMVRWE